MFKFDLNPDEKLIRIYRQTEWVMLKPILIVFACIYLPWWYVAKYELLLKFTKPLLIWTILVALYFANKLILWLLTSYMLTDKRLISIRYRTIFKKQVLETPLERILNISYETTGFFSSLMHFGDIQVQIMGLGDAMTLRHIRNPARIKDFLWKIHSTHAGHKHPFAEHNPGEYEKKAVGQAKSRKM